MRLACFITPHGFGHAARSCAVLAEFKALLPELAIDLYTTVPEWFFADSLPGVKFDYFPVACDIGLVQRGPLEEDIPASVAALDRFWLAAPIAGLAEQLRARQTTLVLCDIAPLGLAAAAQAGIPSVLLENFTWEWIYRGYDNAALHRHADRLAALFELADLRIQCTPCCQPLAGAVSVPPISRRGRLGREATRRRLQLASEEKLVLVSLGGVDGGLDFLPALASRTPATFLLLGQEELGRLPANVRRLPKHSPFFHPDPIAAADLVLGKTGYSTVAEVYAAGTPFLCLSRAAFRESAVLERFVESNPPSRVVDGTMLSGPEAPDVVQQLLAAPAGASMRPNGATEAARWIGRLHSRYKH